MIQIYRQIYEYIDTQIDRQIDRQSCKCEISQVFFRKKRSENYHENSKILFKASAFYHSIIPLQRSLLPKLHLIKKTEQLYNFIIIKKHISSSRRSPPPTLTPQGVRVFVAPCHISLMLCMYIRELNLTYFHKHILQSVRNCATFFREKQSQNFRENSKNFTHKNFIKKP